MDTANRAATFRWATFHAIACGVIALGCAAVAALPLAISLLVGHTRFAWGHILYFAAVSVTMALPAAVYFIVAWQLHKRRTWGAYLGIVVAALHDACALIGLVALIWYVPARGGPVLLAPIGGAIVFIVLCSLLLYHLARILRANPDDRDDPSGGFEVVAAIDQSSDSLRGK